MPRSEFVFDEQRFRVVTNHADQILKNRKWCRKLGYDKLNVTDEAHVQTGERSDPTGSTAVNQIRIRDAYRLGEDSLAKALFYLETADNSYARALRLADNRSPRDDKGENKGFATKDDPLISTTEHDEMKAAQARRMNRGEGVA